MPAYNCVTVDKEGKPYKLWDSSGVYRLETLVVPPYTMRFYILDFLILEANCKSEEDARLQHANMAMETVHAMIESNDTIH